MNPVVQVALQPLPPARADGELNMSVAGGLRDRHHHVTQTVAELVANPAIVSTLLQVGSALDGSDRTLRGHRDHSALPLPWLVRKFIAIGALPWNLCSFSALHIVLHPKAAQAMSRLFLTVAEAVQQYHQDIAAADFVSRSAPPEAAEHDSRMNFDDDLLGMEN